MSRYGVHTQMIWDTPMLGSNDYNYTSGFQGVDFVHGQKGDSWITDPMLEIDLYGSASQDQECGQPSWLPA